MKTNSGRIELGWGGGSFSALLDLRSGKVEAYHGGTDFHTRYGGKCYYNSRTGLTGAGWIPAHPWIKAIGAYRVDVSTRNMFGCHIGSPMVMGKEVFVPYDYRGSDGVEGYPVLVRGEEGVVMLMEHDVVPYLLGEGGELEDREVSTTFFRTAEGGGETRVFHFRSPRGERFAKARRVLEALHHEELTFQWPADVSAQSSLNFWTRLGLHEVLEGIFFKISSDIARASYARDALADVETFQSAVPANVVVLTPATYLQEKSDGQYEAAGIFEIDGRSVDFEISVDSVAALKAMRGDFAAIVVELEAGASAKAAEDRRQREEHARREAEAEAQYLREVAESADQLITREGADPRGWIPREDVDRAFAGKEAMTVSELAAAEGGRRVLEHHFAARRQAVAAALDKQIAANPDGWFRAQVERHGEVMVTFADSRAAGNCDPGTREFRDRNFAGRESVTIAQLARFAGNSNVRRVLEWKLRQLSAQ